MSVDHHQERGVVKEVGEGQDGEGNRLWHLLRSCST
jgi:hypothetical protein